ncbi:MAG TPA: hypothetical protein VGN17_06805 [Bryobacteraceae bacterium]|jgi:hypothetical protein
MSILEFRPGPARTLRSKILTGLPGEGPVPKHFHLGHPTPWSEGFVVRFWTDGNVWVGNFQDSDSGYSEVIAWHEADSFVVIAGNHFYLVDADNPNACQTLGPQNPVYEVMFDEERQTLFVPGS